MTPGCETLRGAAFVAVFRGQVGVLDLFAQKDPNLLTFSAKRKGEWLKTAIEKNNQEVASWLVGKGFCFAQGDIDNYMALKLVLLEDASFLQRLSHASTSSTVSLIRFDTLDVDRVDHEGGNVWHCAAAVVKNAADLERMFTKLPTSSSFTKIHLQQSLIKKNLVDRFSPFHIAAAAGNVAFLQIISRKFRELALPNNQWLDDADNDNALTPLYSAVLANQVESVRELLRLGASTTMRAHFDITPLHAAASDGNLNIAKELTAYDPSLLRTTDKMGRRPIDVVMHEIIVREEEGKPIGQYRALYDCLAEEMKVASR
ncbi:ankyrin repeat domain-containing protein [Candidatus Dependentiae bacterium]|nr:ankyrin repeat domain-containing protein [Candidatus Dependentiae bacterium]